MAFLNFSTMTFFQDDPRAEIHVFQRDSRLDGHSDGFVHLLLLVGRGPLPVGATDCTMDADAFPHPRLRRFENIANNSLETREEPDDYFIIR